MKNEKDNLIQAIEDENIESLQLLLKTTNPNFKNEDGKTPLEIAIDKNSIEMVELLLEDGAKPDYKDGEKETSLSFYFCDFNRVHNIKIVNALLEGGANPNFKKNKRSYSMLHDAVIMKNYKLANELIKYGADVNECENSEFSTPIYFTWSIKSTKLLIDNGAKVDVKDKEGDSPLLHAMLLDAEDRNAEIFKILFKHSKDGIRNVEYYKEIALDNITSNCLDFLNGIV